MKADKPVEMYVVAVPNRKVSSGDNSVVYSLMWGDDTKQLPLWEVAEPGQAVAVFKCEYGNIHFVPGPPGMPKPKVTRPDAPKSKAKVTRGKKSKR